jgi:hypothetical protein
MDNESQNYLVVVRNVPQSGPNICPPQNRSFISWNWEQLFVHTTWSDSNFGQPSSVTYGKRAGQNVTRTQGEGTKRQGTSRAICFLRKCPFKSYSITVEKNIVVPRISILFKRPGGIREMKSCLFISYGKWSSAYSPNTQSDLQFEYLIEFIFIFNTKLVYESRDYVDSFDVKREGENLVKVHRVIGNDQLKL